MTGERGHYHAVRCPSIHEGELNVPWPEILKHVPRHTPTIQRYEFDVPGEIEFHRQDEAPTATLIRPGDTVIVVRGPAWPTPLKS